MIKILCIAAGGAAGALARYAVGGKVQGWSSSTFPWGTMAVNLTGCLLIGLLAGLFERAATLPEVRALVLIGFLGAYTTFSTFSLESMNLLRDREYGWLAVNVLVSNVGGLALAAAGLMLARGLAGLLARGGT